MPVRDPHLHCLECLGKSHVRDKCFICCGFKTRTEKQKKEHLHYILMEAAFRPVLQHLQLSKGGSLMTPFQSAPTAMPTDWRSRRFLSPGLSSLKPKSSEQLWPQKHKKTIVLVLVVESALWLAASWYWLI